MQTRRKTLKQSAVLAGLLASTGLFPQYALAYNKGAFEAKNVADVLKALGPKGYLVNVARGSVVDEEALVQALVSGVIAGAGLDVFANEPHVPEALWSMPNVVLTPHMASATHQTRQAMADLAFANMQAGLSGQPLLTPVPECMAAQGR